MPKLTHLDAANRPTMVDVGAKTATFREASAEATVKLPPAVARELDAHRTSHEERPGVRHRHRRRRHGGEDAPTRSIPFCHPLPLERCTVDIATGQAASIHVVCSVAVHHKTGVEMEALVGASAAALTIYDMCKALSHDIEIGPVRLLRKTGGKRDFSAQDAHGTAEAP